MAVTASIGISVNVSLHICHGYEYARGEFRMTAPFINLQPPHQSANYSTGTRHHTLTDPPGKPNSRLKQSLHIMGPPVLKGAFTTLLGVCLLNFASSEVFRSFFQVRARSRCGRV